MAKRKSAKEREPTWAYSGLNAKPSKLNRIAKGAPANAELQERFKSSVQAFEEKRKPRWVVLQPAEPAGQAEVIMENTEAGEDPAKQPRDMASMKNTQLGENPQHGELDLQADEPATGPGSSSPVPSDWTLEHLLENLKSSADDDEGDQGWGLTHDQMYRDVTGQDRVAIMHSGPFSFVVPSTWAFDHVSGCEEQDSRPYAMVFY
ncbi:uncharacterized protein LOC134063451 [Sardina pilchardus]|uniref:uncharacterized protein LOC134063451 n=1 Tax=Sardina pilchardus TaxID=27697 RepID=UPI002E13BB3C